MPLQVHRYDFDDELSVDSPQDVVLSGRTIVTLKLGCNDWCDTMRMAHLQRFVGAIQRPSLSACACNSQWKRHSQCSVHRLTAYREFKASQKLPTFTRSFGLGVPYFS